MKLKFLFVLLIIPSVLIAQKGYFYVSPSVSIKNCFSHYYTSLGFKDVKSKFWYNTEDIQFQKLQPWQTPMLDALLVGVRLGYQFPKIKTSIEIGIENDNAGSGYNIGFKAISSDTIHVRSNQAGSASYSGRQTLLIPIVVNTNIWSLRGKTIFGKTRNTGINMDVMYGMGIMKLTYKNQFNPSFYSSYITETNAYTLTDTSSRATLKPKLILLFGLKIIPFYKNRDLFDISILYEHGFSAINTTFAKVEDLQNNLYFYNSYGRGSGLKISISKRINISKLFNKKKFEE